MASTVPRVSSPPPESRTQRRWNGSSRRRAAYERRSVWPLRRAICGGDFDARARGAVRGVGAPPPGAELFGRALRALAELRRTPDATDGGPKPFARARWHENLPQA